MSSSADNTVVIGQQQLDREKASITKNTSLLHKKNKSKGGDDDEKPRFAEVKIQEVERQHRKVRVPGNRYAPLKRQWDKIYVPIVEKMNLQIRMDVRERVVELRTCEETTDPNAIQKAVDFLNAFMLGFDADDALAMLRLDDIYVETFLVTDVKNLKGDHLGRAVGRIAGKNGAVRFTIENASKTRIVIADQRISIMGSFKNIQIAKNAIVDLILGSPPGQVYNKLRIVASRMKETF